MRVMYGSAALALLFAAIPALGARTLDIHFIDVEGGQATLLVTPHGESVLTDAGWPGFDGRDADRIVAAAKRAGLKQIDYLVVTHYHRDHVGGVEQLAARFPIKTFVDHGPNTETGQNAEELYNSYERAAAKGKRMIVKPGDRIPLKGVEAIVVTARGERIQKSLTGGGAANPLCAGVEKKEVDTGENARSLGVVYRYGKFRFANLGDLTWNKELELACPLNLIGAVDLYLTTHHGLHTSGNPALVHAMRPRVAVMNNGARKGGTPEAWKTVKASPGLESLWQLHYSVAGGEQHNVEERWIANLEENCQGHGISVSAGQDGSFEVRNLRNGVKQSYAAPQ
jgi:beta-lactamase superfamily II metal-dependent hydrolase